jgi:hypothetical protein
MDEATIEDFVIPSEIRGNLTKSDGSAVSSTTFSRGISFCQAGEHKIKKKRGELLCAG